MYDAYYGFVQVFCPSVTMMDTTAREDTTEARLNDDNTTLPAKFVIGASDEDFEEQAEYKEEIVVRMLIMKKD